jgi:hypothetical protein
MTKASKRERLANRRGAETLDVTLNRLAAAPGSLLPQMVSLGVTELIIGPPLIPEMECPRGLCEAP